MVVKPNPKSFVGIFVTWFVLIGAAVGIGISFFDVVLGSAIGTVIPILAYAYRYKQYDKEAYELTENGVQVSKGTWFSDHEILVPWDRVTTVNYQQPFLERVLFGTGLCYVDSAGSSYSSITLRHVDTALPTALRDKLLAGDEASQHIRPNKPAAIAKGVWNGLTSLIGLAFVFFVPAQQTTIGTGTVVVGAIIVSLVLSALTAARKIIDDVALHYECFTDHVAIRGGVFRKQHHVLLADHITDTASDQTVLDRLLDVERATVSVAGGEREVSVPYVALEASFIKHIPRATSTDDSVEDEDDSDSVTERSNGEPLMTSPDVLRSYAGLFLVALLASPVFVTLPITMLLFFGYAGNILLRPFVTTYAFTGDTVRSTFTFFQRKTTTFDVDRVTGVIITKNPLDHVFNTATVAVQSVGSSSRLVFHAVPETNAFVAEVSAVKERVTNEHTVLPETGLSSVLNRFLPLWLLGLSVVGGFFGRSMYLAGTAMFGALLFGYVWAWWRLHYASLIYGDQAFELRSGAWFQRRVLGEYADIKRLESTLYPFSDIGSMGLYLPGGSQASVVQGFTMPCIRNPWKQHGVIEGCAYADAWSSPIDPVEREWSDQPAILAVLLRSVLGAMVFIGLVGGTTIVFDLPVYAVIGSIVVSAIGVIAYITWYKQVRYERTPKRFIEERGVLYRSATTVLRDRIDYDDLARLWYHKISGTGTVSLYTTGSEEKDLVVDSVASYRAVTTDK